MGYHSTLYLSNTAHPVDTFWVVVCCCLNCLFVGLGCLFVVVEGGSHFVALTGLEFRDLLTAKIKGLCHHTTPTIKSF